MSDHDDAIAIVEAEAAKRYPMGATVTFVDGNVLAGEEPVVATGFVNGTPLAQPVPDTELGGHRLAVYVRVAVPREGKEHAHIAVHESNVVGVTHRGETLR